MKGFWCIILVLFGGVGSVTAQPYWAELTDNEREFLAHSGKVSPMARSYFQDPSLLLTDSTQANQLMAEIGNCDQQHLPFYWQLFAQTKWPATFDSAIAASHLVNLLERYPNFVMGYYAQGHDKRTSDRYTAILADGYRTTPWLYTNTKDLKKRLRKQVDKAHRKAVKSFIRQLEAAF